MRLTRQAPGGAVRCGVCGFCLEAGLLTKLQGDLAIWRNFIALPALCLAYARLSAANALRSVFTSAIVL